MVSVSECSKITYHCYSTLIKATLDIRTLISFLRLHIRDVYTYYSFHNIVGNCRRCFNLSGSPVNKVAFSCLCAKLKSATLYRRLFCSLTDRYPVSSVTIHRGMKRNLFYLFWLSFFLYVNVTIQTGFQTGWDIITQHLELTKQGLGTKQLIEYWDTFFVNTYSRLADMIVTLIYPDAVFESTTPGLQVRLTIVS